MKIKSRLKMELEKMLPHWHFTQSPKTAAILTEIEVRRAIMSGRMKTTPHFGGDFYSKEK